MHWYDALARWARRGPIAIGILLALMLAGCVSSDPDDSDPQRIQVETGTFILDQHEGKWFGLPWDQDILLEYSVQVTDGPPIDIWVMDSTNRDSYEDGSAFAFIGACSNQGASSVDTSCMLPAGRYYIVYDNSIRGKEGQDSIPDRDAIVEHSVWATMV